jgi:phosphotransferase system IIB component
MYKRILGLAVLSTLLLTACSVEFGRPSITITLGSGKVITENRDMRNFSALSLAVTGDLTITQGQTEALTIEAEDNIVPHIKTEVRDGTLFISFDRQNWQDWLQPTRPIKFNLALENLTAVESSGAENIKSASIKTERLSLKLNGAGNVKIDRLEASEIVTVISGAGNVDLAGQVTRQEATLNGVGSYRAGDLNSQVAKITVNGAGGATLWAREGLDVRVTGAGGVNYYGNPTVTKDITGVGIFRSLGDK